jgi:hypothetical protein
MSSCKVVKLTYSNILAFCIPKNINLEDETQVESWSVKGEKLYIYLTNGKKLIINYFVADEIDYNYHCEEEIVEAEDVCIDEQDEGFNEVDVGEK